MDDKIYLKGQSNEEKKLSKKGYKARRGLIAIIAILILLVTGCSQGADSTNVASAEETGIAVSNGSGETTSESETVSIVLGETPVIEGSTEGIDVKEGHISITKGGVYALSGTWEDGQITLEAKDEIFTLILNGVTIKSSNGPAILSLDAEMTNIILMEGTVNTLTDGGQVEDYEAPLFSCDDMTIEGTGTLVINGTYQEGIESNDILTINGGNIEIIAEDDALNAGDGIIINGGTILAKSGGDGIDSNGDLTINGGSITVFAGNNANGPVDIRDGGYKYIINGGDVFATGGTMTIQISNESTQKSAWIYGTFNSGDTVELKNSNGDVIANQTLLSSASCIYVSNSSLEDGQTYTIYQNDTELGSFDMSGISASYGNAGGRRGGGQGQRPENGMPMNNDQNGAEPFAPGGEMGNPPEGNPPMGSPTENPPTGEAPTDMPSNSTENQSN